MIDVFLADDHEILRAGLAALLDAHPDLRVVGQASTGAETLTGLAHARADVLVLDLSLPDVMGLEMLGKVKAAHPGLPIVILTMYPEDQLALTMVRAGAAAYLNKSRPSSEVLTAIVRVAAGKRYLTDTLLEFVLDPATDGAAPPHTRLSAREHQAFMLLIGGRTVSEAAITMDVSPSTASTYVSKIKQKLGVESVGGIIRYAHRVGLLG